LAKASKNNSEPTAGSSEYGVSAEFEPDVPSREAVLRVLREAASDLTPRALGKALGVKYPFSEGLLRRLQAMQRDGQVVADAKGRLSAVASSHFISGRVQGHRDGFGFLIRDDGQADLFLPPREMLKVWHGDRVSVRQEGMWRDKPQAVIVEVLERRTHQLVGRFLRENGVPVMVPEDQRIKRDVLLAAGETGGAQPGQIVVVEIVRQPMRHAQPLGRVVEVLGQVDDPGMEIEIAVRKFDVPVAFSEATHAEAAALPEAVRKKDLQGRVDLRDLPFITIDGEDARDFDDAVYCERVNLGSEQRRRAGWRLLVAIADVSHYVTPTSSLDADALERGTSVYFPRRVIPMLPEALSNGLCSLNPQVDRLALVCDMVLPEKGSKAGEVTAYQFYPAVIRSHARTTYTDVWAALQQPTGPATKALGDLYENVKDLHALYQLLHAARSKRGAMDFDTVETRIVCNPLGRIERIEPSERNDAHRLIEACMLAANTCAADFIRRNKRLGLYRVHEGPTADRLTSLRDYLKLLGLTLDGGDAPTPQDYMQMLAQARQRPDYPVIQTMCLRSMQQAIYSPEESGHFGLAYAHYAHFTSPIRRYPDLLMHRVIKSILNRQRYVPRLPGMEERGDGRVNDQEKSVSTQALAREHERSVWEQLGVTLSARERRADEASRDVEIWLKCWFIKEYVGEVFSGRVTGVTNFGLFITLDTLFVEGLVHVSELGSDYFQYVEASHELRGERTGVRYRLTDPVQVQVARVDLESRRIDFKLVKGTSFKALKKGMKADSSPADSARRSKKAASTKPAALKKTTARQRRAEEKRSAKKAKPVAKKRR